MSDPKPEDLPFPVETPENEGHRPSAMPATPPPRQADQGAVTMPGAPNQNRTHSGVTDPLLGTVLDDRYRIIRRLGTGGMATVYLAEHMFIGRRVALKVLHPQLAMEENFVRRFLNEGRAAGTLGHPNIIASTDMGTTPLGQPYLVLEYLEGKDLAQVIDRDGALPPVRAARVAVQVASALAAAHAAKIIHRDLKAENIFLLNRNDRRDEVRVIDFGISKFGTTNATSAGLLIGTPQYMSPEQLSSPSEVDERADIYALGVILFQMLTGKLPFNDPTIPGLVAKIANEQPADLTNKVPGIPQAFAKLVASALAKSPNDRPESMAAFEEALERFANLGSPSLEMPAATVGGAASSGSEKKRSAMVPLVAVGALLALGVAAMVLRPWESKTGTAGGPAVAVTPTPTPTPPPEAVVAPPVVAPTPTPTPAAVAAAAPVAPTIHLKISSPIKKARVAFRGRVFMLPQTTEVKSGTSPESIEVTAPGHAGRRFWVSFDRDLELTVPLTKGMGVVEASETETAVALGNAPPEALEAMARPAVQRPDKPEVAARAPEPVKPAEPVKADAPRPVAKADPVKSDAPRPVARADPVKPDAPRPAGKTEPAKTAEPVKVATPEPSPAAPVVVAAVTPRPPEPSAEGTEAPKPKVEAMPTINAMESPDMRNSVNGQMGQLKPCIDGARKDNPDFSGNVTLTMEVNPDGSVATASANAGQGQGRFAACIIKTVRKWNFPKPTSGVKTRVVLPLFLG